MTQIAILGTGRVASEGTEGADRRTVHVDGMPQKGQAALAGIWFPFS